MRWFFLVVTFLYYPSFCPCQVLLNEVYYDHPGSDEGHEFVELINLSNLSQSLSGYVLGFHDGTSAGWVTIWRAGAHDTIPATGLFVVGGESVAPLPDAVCDLGLQNGPDAIRLMSATGVADCVGYGELAGGGYYEGQSAPDVPSGSSLSRRPDGVDTDNNLADFAVMRPSPGRFNVPRRDFALRPGRETQTRDVHTERIVEQLRLRVINEGLSAAESGAVMVELRDSTVFGVRSEPSLSVREDIAAGDSIEVEFAVDLQPGYHWIRARVVYAADERPENNTVDIVRRVGASAVIVSEVMSHPREGCPEYVELFNTGDANYDLLGHRIRDAAHDPALIVSRSVTIPPRGVVVLTREAKTLLGCFGRLPPEVVIEIAGDWPSLNHSGSGSEADSVTILDAHSLFVDRISYPPQSADTRGRSLERLDLYPGNGRHTWVLNNTPEGGSPGLRHSEAILALPTETSIDVSPNPFDPYQSEILVVTVPDQGEPNRVVIGVFDLGGRRLVEIGSTTVLPSVFVWDGSNEASGTVLPGIYVLACEFFSMRTGTRRVEKVVVGCARRKGG